MATSVDAPPGQPEAATPVLEPEAPPSGRVDAYPRTRLGRLGAISARHPWRFIIVWVILTGAAFAVAVGGITGETLFQRLHSGAPSAPSEAQTGQNLIQQNQASSDSLTLQVTGADLSDAAAVAAATSATQSLAQIPNVTSVTSPFLLPGEGTALRRSLEAHHKGRRQLASFARG